MITEDNKDEDFSSMDTQAIVPSDGSCEDVKVFGFGSVGLVKEIPDREVGENGEIAEEPEIEILEPPPKPAPQFVDLVAEESEVDGTDTSHIVVPVPCTLRDSSDLTLEELNETETQVLCTQIVPTTFGSRNDFRDTEADETETQVMVPFGSSVEPPIANEGSDEIETQVVPVVTCDANEYSDSDDTQVLTPASPDTQNLSDRSVSQYRCPEFSSGFKVPTLLKLSSDAIRENIDSYKSQSLRHIPYSVLAPILARISVLQLIETEKNNSYLLGLTEYIWSLHSFRFQGKERKKSETWRDFYNRYMEADRELPRIANGVSHVESLSETNLSNVSYGKQVKTEMNVMILSPPRSGPPTSSAASRTSTSRSSTVGSGSGSGLNGFGLDDSDSSDSILPSIRNRRKVPKHGRLSNSANVPVITISSDTPPPSPRPSAPYTDMGRGISDAVIQLQESCFRELQECVNARCKGNYPAPSDNALTVVAIEMPRTATELGKLPGMSLRVQDIYWKHMLKITKNYLEQKHSLYKSAVIPVTLQEAKDLYGSNEPATTGVSKGRQRNKGAKRRQSPEVTIISDDDSTDNESSREVSPPAKRTRRSLRHSKGD